MVNPHYRVQLAPGTRYIIDSGAFQERDMACRLEPWQALERQLKLERWIAYHNGSAYAEALISYDMLDGVDETLTEAGRIKQRGTDVTASRAVQETIRSAHIYRALRDRVAGAIAYACQGVSTAQYLACARQILPLLRSGRDWFAFGGLCITGMQRRTMLPIFQATLEAVFPLLATYGVGTSVRGNIMTIREEKMKTVLILRTCTASLTSQGGFQWPTSGHVAAPDWKPTQACGHGLHGLLWGCGDASLLDWSEQAKWLVVEVTEASIIDLGDKVKFPEGTVVYCGDRNGAANLIAACPVCPASAPGAIRGYRFRNDRGTVGGMG